jgi:peptidoglycan/xylan/chitin deacetylase (PgdA/CDA1 family)
MTSTEKIAAAPSSETSTAPGVFFYPPRKARPATAQPVPILTYHQFVADSAPRRRRGPLCITQAQFARQMALVHALGYRGLSMGELKPYLTGEKTGRVVGITMDDGYLSNLELALPVLQRWGFTATCFMVSGHLGQSNVWDSAEDGPFAPLMDVAQLQAWMAGGQEVGSHTHSHCDLTRCSPELAWQEIKGSRDQLEHALSAPVQHFSYPYGFLNPEHVAMVQQAGYDTALTTRGGRARSGQDLFTLPRLEFVNSFQLAFCLSKPALRLLVRPRSESA